MTAESLHDAATAGANRSTSTPASTPASAGTDRSQPSRSREAQWARLDALLAAAASAGGRLTALGEGEVSELGRLYRAASTQLALARTGGASIAERERLNDLVGRAHALIYGVTSPPAGSGARAWLVALLLAPVAVRRTWRYHALAALLLLVGAAYGWAGAASDREWALELVLQGGDERTPYATRDELLATLHAGRPDSDRAMDAGEKAMFAAALWQNNTRVALLGFFAGPLAGLPTAAVLVFNGMVLGAYSHTFVSRGLAWDWWAWILPHGVTELLAIVLLAGGGLWLGHLMVVPGADRTRREALRDARPDVLRLALLAFPMLLLAALLESFVRQSGLTEPQRYLFAAATALFWLLWLGLARPPARWLAALSSGPVTRAERAAPLLDPPADDGLAGLEDALRSLQRR